MNQTVQKPKKSSKAFIITVGVLLTAGAAVTLYVWKKNKKTAEKKKAFEEALQDSKNVSPTSSDSTSSNSIPTATRNDNFPLKKGSKGNRVKNLQNALIASYGKDILPKYGADGDFGSETEGALKKINKPIVLTEEEYNKIVLTTTTNPKKVGQQLNTAATNKDLNAVLKLLQELKSTTDYLTANYGFKETEINGRTQTIVSGLFDVFREEVERQKLRVEFTRMGLERVYSEAQKDYIWQIPTLNGLPIITKVATKVWVNRTESLDVPANMILGNEVGKQLDYTQFENNGRKFLVLSKDIRSK